MKKKTNKQSPCKKQIKNSKLRKNSFRTHQKEIVSSLVPRGSSYYRIGYLEGLFKYLTFKFHNFKKIADIISHPPIKYGTSSFQVDYEAGYIDGISDGIDQYKLVPNDKIIEYVREIYNELNLEKDLLRYSIQL